jgi:hypothetical protein
VIRFSAALVAVAIGVLVGGIAASELSLVYIAIVVSAVALVALAAGVVLKREELFGEGQGLLAPAGAGASPVLPVQAGESQDHNRPGVPVTPPPLQGVVVGPGAAFGGNTQAVPAQSAAPWETETSHGPWASAAPAARTTWAPAAQDERTGNGAGSGADTRTAAAWQATAPSSGISGGRVGGWGLPDAAPPAAPAAESGSAPPSWFDRRDRQATTDAPATTPASASGSGWSWPTAGTAAPEDVAAAPEDTDNAGTDEADHTEVSHTEADHAKAEDTAALDATGTPPDTATAVDEDDDWPTRYSWLDDEPDENGEPSGEASVENTAAKPDESVETADPEDHPSPSPSPFAATLAAEPAAPGDSGTPETETPDAGTPDEGTPEATAIELGDADEDEDEDAPADVAAPATHGDPVRLSLVTDHDHEADPDLEAETTDEAADDAESEAPTGDAAPGTGQVAVIRGVPRYHDEDCVLIRFMPEGDTRKLSIADAKELGCTPCAACQPVG